MCCHTPYVVVTQPNHLYTVSVVASAASCVNSLSDICYSLHIHQMLLVFLFPSYISMGCIIIIHAGNVLVCTIITSMRDRAWQCFESVCCSELLFVKTVFVVF